MRAVNIEMIELVANMLADDNILEILEGHLPYGVPMEGVHKIHSILETLSKI